MTNPDTMTNEELRVAVAEARGWVFVQSEPDEGGSFAGWWKHPNGAGCGYTDSVLPNFPADHNAAMTLCDALAKEGWSVKMERWDTDNEWSCAFFHKDHDTIYGDAPTLAIAICRAYLAVIQSQPPTT